MSNRSPRAGDRASEKGIARRPFAPAMSEVSLACRSLGLNCEWATHASSPPAAVAQFAQHAKCAHKMPELDAATQQRAAASARLLA